MAGPLTDTTLAVSLTDEIGAGGTGDDGECNGNVLRPVALQRDVAGGSLRRALSRSSQLHVCALLAGP